MISCTKWAQFCISGVYLHIALPGKRKPFILQEFAMYKNATANI